MTLFDLVILFTLVTLIAVICTYLCHLIMWVFSKPSAWRTEDKVFDMTKKGKR